MGPNHCDAVQVADTIGQETAEGPALSSRNLTQEHYDMVDKVAEDIRIKFDRIVDGQYKK